MVSDAGLGPLSFADFLEKMKEPAAADLVRMIKAFVKQFDDRPSGYIADPEADSALVQEFYARMEPAYRVHPLWRGSPETIPGTMEGLEKYVMSKLWYRTFGCHREEKDRDERYHRLAQALSFVDLSVLIGAQVTAEESLVAAAIEELLRMDRYKAPRDKLVCLVNVKTLIEDTVAAAVRAGASIGGADAFFPVFLLVVIRAQLPRLASNLEYVRRFRARPRLSGQFDYMLCNLESAAMYLDTVDWRHLQLSQDEFLARLSAAGIPEAEMELRWREREKVDLNALPTATRSTAETVDTTVNQPLFTNSSTSQRLERGTGLQDSVNVTGASPTELLADPATEEPPGQGDKDAIISLKEAGELSPTENAASSFAEETQKRFKGTAVPLLELPTASVDVSTASLTPLGETVKTPHLIKTESVVSENVAQPYKPEKAEAAIAAAGPSSRLDFVAAMQEGIPHLLQEEASGRLQQRNPWIYASAEDLSLPDVRALLASYRDLVLRHEAVLLALQQQPPGVVATQVKSGLISDNGNLSISASNPPASAESGVFLQRLVGWSKLSVDGELHEGADSNKERSDTRILHSLFGSPRHARRLSEPLVGVINGEQNTAPLSIEAKAAEGMPSISPMPQETEGSLI